MDKRASYAGQPYWGRPISGWGDAEPGVLIVGLAPAAHGGNRTGRIFTGDRSGDWLFAALHRAGLATRETSVHAGDGQRLLNTRMVAAVRCAPPQNKPTTEERDTCSPWIEREITLVAPHVRAVVALGSFGWDAALRAFRAAGHAVPTPEAEVRPRRRGARWARASRCSAATTPASRTPSPASSPRRCWTTCWPAQRRWRAERRVPSRLALAPVSQPAEEEVLKTFQCGFEPHRGYRSNWSSAAPPVRPISGQPPRSGRHAGP